MRSNRIVACGNRVLRSCSGTTEMPQINVRENLLHVQERIAVAASRCGRRPEEITLIGVSKTHPEESIRAAFEAGLRHFGENRVQEWEGKRAAVADLGADWHLIGHLQSNKAARAARLFHSIDSIDDFRLAERIDRACGERPSGARLRVLIEVHLGGEETKSGVSPDGLPDLAEKMIALTCVNLAGLMCIPPFRENPDEVRPYFARLCGLKRQLEERLGRRFPVLSMGMSHDFEAAIFEGATEVRVGTALFGVRGTAC
jgi:PLP dependent protein